MYTVDEFATELKARYPQYAQLSNQELVDKAITKKPELKNQIQFSTVPKKYSRKEFATKLKTRYPQYAEMDGDELIEKAIAKKPELANSIQEDKPSFIDKAKSFVAKGAAKADEAIRSFVDKNEPGQREEINKIKEKFIKKPFDEEAFRKWYADKSVKYNLNVDPDDPLHYYDYREAYLADATPDAEGHWPSEFKKEGHPRMVVDGVNTKTGKKIPIKNSFAPPEQTAVQTDPLIEEKYKAVAESESAFAAGVKEAGLALTYADSPVSKYRRQEHPVASTVGAVAGTVAPMLVGGTGAVKSLTAVPKIANIMKAGKTGQVAVNGVARMATAAVDYLARHNEELLSEDPAISGAAKKNLVINLAASAASPLPETFLPKNLIQPFAQGATDLLVEVIGQATTGDNAFSEENLVNTIASTIAGTAFGFPDIRSAKDKALIKALKEISEGTGVLEKGIPVRRTFDRTDAEAQVRNKLTDDVEAKRGGELTELEEELQPPRNRAAQEEAPSVFQSEGMKKINADILAKLDRVKAAEKEAGQRGSIKLPGEFEKTPIPFDGDANVEKTLEAGRFQSLSPVKKIKDSVDGVINSIKQNFTKFEKDVERFPQYKDDKRTQFMPMRRHLFDTVAKYRHASLSQLYKKEGKKGLRRATDILLLRNLKLRGEGGQTIENNLSVKEIVKHLNWLENTSSPEVMTAVEDTKTILKGLGEELVSRGKLSAESLEEDYFPHKVLDYLPDFMRGLKTPMNRKFGEPYRPYTRKAIGSKRLIASDDSVIWTHIAKVLADNAQEDWFVKQAMQYDASAKVSPEERKKFHKGYETIIGGKRYKVLEWKKPRYKVKAISENAMANALQSDMLIQDWLQTKTVTGKEPIRDVLVSGKPQTYLLPKEIAVDLDNLIEKSPPIFDLLYRMGHLTQKWKGFTLTSAMLPYQFGNIIGDNIMTSLYDPVAFGYMPTATKIARKIFYPNSKVKLNDAEQKLYDVAEAKDVASSGMSSELRFSPVGGTLDKYRTASEFRESLARLAILAHQLDRNDKGQPIQNLAGIDLTGLDPESAAGKVAREALVDYTAVPRSYNLFLSRGLLPFVRFHEGTFRNLARATTRNKGTHKAAKIIAPIAASYAAQWAYNNLQVDKKELEMQLPDYIRNRWHINLGKTDEGNIAVWAAQQPVDMAMSWLGLDNMNRIASDLKDGRTTPKQAAEDFIKAFQTGALENISSLMNPVIQMWTGLKTNEDPFTKQKIMPDAIHKQGAFSKYGAKYSIGYMAEKIFSPVMQYNRTKRSTDPDQHPLYDWILKGPLNIKRALGFYEINPTTQKLAQHFKVIEPLSAAKEYYRTRFYNIIDEYGKDLLNALKARKAGTALTTNQQKAIRSVEKLSAQAKDNGFTALDYGKWFKNMTAQRKIIDAELRKTSDKKERKKLRERKQELINASQIQYMKQVPKTARKHYMNQMEKRKSLPGEIINDRN